MKIEAIIKRVDQLIESSKRILAAKRFVEGEGQKVDFAEFRAYRAACLSFIKSTFGESSPYYTEFSEHVKNNYYSYTETAQRILVALREELAGGWVVSFKGLVSAEIFADFLEMAEYLLGEKYEHAAAVIIGSALEGHLRQLCQKNGIDTAQLKDGKMVPKKADLLNSELAGKNVYNKLDQKTITANLDLRNKAAHGQYNEYSREQVQLMLQSVSDFMARNP